MKRFLSFPCCILPVALFLFLISVSCKQTETYYTADDFYQLPKSDVHFHYLTMDTCFMELARELHFRLLSPIWEGEEASIDTQLYISSFIHHRYPSEYAYFTAFPTVDIRNREFAVSTIEYIKEHIREGAKGVKIWKNIGMVLQKQDSSFIMISDPVFSPIFSFLEKEQIPVIGHLGEPKDCWQPLNEMTDAGDVSYYRINPQYHMYLHPEVPSYEAQLDARDSILARYPLLHFTGAHLGSMEWSVDEVSRRMDRYPNFNVDLAGRMGHLKNQSQINHDRVREFFIRYQTRILYGTDSEVHDLAGISQAERKKQLLQTWMEDWLYLATDSLVNGFRGLKLPAKVVEKIYNTNASVFFN